MPFFLLFIFIIFLIFLSRPKWGLYLTVFLAPFLGLVIVFSRFEWTQTIPYLQNIDGPMADFVVMLLFGAMMLKILWQYRHRLLIGAPLHGVGFWYFFPFFLSGILSLFNVSYDQFGGSLKYLLRPILFFYLMWICLPVILIDSEKVLNRVIKIFFWTGLLSALMGLISLFISPSVFGFWRRAAPLAFWGFAPLAYNHNLLAEVLVAVAPLAFYLFVSSQNRHPELVSGSHQKNIQKFYFLSFILITTIALFTFARAAWLALAVELLIYLFASKAWFQLWPSATRGTTREAGGGVPRSSEARAGTFIAICLILPLLIYMLLFSFSPIVRSSNATRLDLTGIALTYFKIHPLVGNGVGTFLPLVEQTRLFTVEYGDPLDAHGVIQKLMAEQGLLGLITFFIFVGWIISRLYQGWQLAEEKHRLLLLCLFLSVSGGLTYQLFNTSYYNAHLWLPVGIALAGVKIFKEI